MNLARTSRFIIKRRYDFLSNYRLSAKICTSLHLQNQELSSDSEKPYPFLSKMKEGQFTVEETFQKKENHTWKYQPHVVTACFFIFMLYFCVLREPHDVDAAFAKKLYEAFPGMEVEDLKRDIIKAKKKGLDTSEMEERLAELKKKLNL